MCLETGIGEMVLLRYRKWVRDEVSQWHDVMNPVHLNPTPAGTQLPRGKVGWSIVEVSLLQRAS